MLGIQRNSVMNDLFQVTFDIPKTLKEDIDKLAKNYTDKDYDTAAQYISTCNEFLLMNENDKLLLDCKLRLLKLLIEKSSFIQQNPLLRVGYISQILDLVAVDSEDYNKYINLRCALYSDMKQLPNQYSDLLLLSQVSKDKSAVMK